MGEVILTMKGIDKSFPGVHALDHVDLEVRKGEVHALMGENGAGKSTLMKVLTGIYTKDSGTITYEGREVEFHNPKEAQEAGIVIVHQELNMMNHLTVAQNIFIGFCGKTQHEVEFDIAPAAFKSLCTGVQNFIFRQVFVDYIAQTLGSGFWCEGQTALADSLQFFH